MFTPLQNTKIVIRLRTVAQLAVWLLMIIFTLSATTEQTRLVATYVTHSIWSAYTYSVLKMMNTKLGRLLINYLPIKLCCNTQERTGLPVLLWEPKDLRRLKMTSQSSI